MKYSQISKFDYIFYQYTCICTVFMVLCKLGGVKMDFISKVSPKILKDFLIYLLQIRGYSINTIKSYCSDLQIFFYFIKEYFNLNYINIFVITRVREEDILAFLVYLNTKDNAPSTRNRRLIAIRNFYNWLFTIKAPGINKVNPTEHVVRAVSMALLPKYLTLAQAKNITNIFTKENCQYPTRNNLIISLFLSSALRISELVNINISDINLYNCYINIWGKGRKERRVFYNRCVGNQLSTYLPIRYGMNTNINALFVNSKGNRLGVDGVENVCKLAYKLAGIDNCNYTAHTLRHTSATLMYQYGNVDVKTLQELLGHKSIMATQIYTHVENEELRKAVDSNPLNFIA